jgi:hypothetical protein
MADILLPAAINLSSAGEVKACSAQQASAGIADVMS